MRRRPFRVLVVVAVVAACAFVVLSRKPDARTAELKQLAGVWVTESATLGGRPFPYDPQYAKYEIKGPYKVQVRTGVALMLDLDPSADPKRMTMTEMERQGWGYAVKADGAVNKCVYALDGDILTVAIGWWPNPDYPVSVTPKPGDPVMLLVYKRVKN